MLTQLYRKRGPRLLRGCRQQASRQQQWLVPLPDQYQREAEHDGQCKADLDDPASFHFRSAPYHAGYRLRWIIKLTHLLYRAMP